MNRAVVALLVVHLAGCATEAELPGYGEGLGTPENPVPRDDLSYAVSSQVGSSEAPIPTAVLAVGARLRAFAAAPADTLLAVAGSASMPELAQLYAELPSTLSTRLRGWIDVELDKLRVGTVTLRKYATDVSSFAESTLTHYSIDSTLKFSPTATSHSLRALRFRIIGLDVVVPIGGLKADVIAQKPTVSVAEAGAVTFGEQTFGLAFGSHAWHAINLASTQQYGTEVVAALSQSVNCRLVALTVATKCYSTSCVGHASQLEAVCQKAFQLMVTELSTRVGEQGLDELHVASGTARLIDSNIDGLADTIEGAWNVDLLTGSSSVNFTAETIR